MACGVSVLIKKNWQKLLTATILAGNLLLSVPVEAEIKNYTANIEEITGEMENQEVSKQRTLDKSIKNVINQIYIDLKGLNSGLSDEEIFTIANNTYKIVGEPEFNREVKKLTNKTDIIVWKATVDVNFDDSEIKKWIKRDENEKFVLINQNRELKKLFAENEQKLEEFRKQSEQITKKQEKNYVKAAIKYLESEFLSNQKVKIGNRYNYENRITDAIQLYGEAIVLNENNVAAYNNRGQIYKNIADKKAFIEKDIPAASSYRQMAIADFDKAIRINPNYAEIYKNRGLIHFANKNYEQAIKDFNRAVQIEPNNAENYINRANYYRQVKNNELSLADYNKAAELEPNNAQIYFKRGNFYEQDAKDNNKAVDDYSRMISLEKREKFLILGYHSRAGAYKKLKMYEKAIADYTKCISLIEKGENTSLLPWAYRFRGECYKSLGNEANFQADMKKFEDLQRK